MAYKSRYTPINKDKYMGDPNKIICRSMWERKVCKYLDSNKNILRWGSEEVIVPYYSPIDKKIHRYYPDFIIEKESGTGEVETLLVEVKPLKQTTKPKVRKRKTKYYINECITFEINAAKWKSAREYCEKNGWKFIIITEKDIFSSYK